jgi:hypothetical protein
MINAPVVEQLFFDYKRSSTVLPGVKLSDDDRKNLAKAIAGFGNSEGGVVVWVSIAVARTKVMFRRSLSRSAAFGAQDLI